MSDILRFGPSGNSPSFYDAGYKTSVQAPAWLESVGLNAYEYSFGRGFTLSAEKAKLIGEEAKAHNIMVSVHAPYYINLANPSDEMFEKSINYILKSFEMLTYFQGEHLVVHIGSCGKLKREEAIELIKSRMPILIERIKENGYDKYFLCIETMGKPAQIGNEYEIIDLCSMADFIIPTFDFGHINALSGGQLKSYDDYKKIIDYAIEKLGFEKVKNCHVHFSKIEYGDKGEIRHLNYNDNDYGPDFVPFAQIIKEYNLTPTIICESKDYMAEDAIIMRDIYKNL